VYQTKSTITWTQGESVRDKKPLSRNKGRQALCISISHTHLASNPASHPPDTLLTTSHLLSSFRQQHHQFMSYSATHIFAPVVEAQEVQPTYHQPCLASRWIRSSTTRSPRAARSVSKISTYQTGVFTRVPAAIRYAYTISKEPVVLLRGLRSSRYASSATTISRRQ